MTKRDKSEQAQDVVQVKLDPAGLTSGRLRSTSLAVELTKRGTVHLWGETEGRSSLALVIEARQMDELCRKWLSFRKWDVLPGPCKRCRHYQVRTNDAQHGDCPKIVICAIRGDFTGCAQFEAL